MHLALADAFDQLLAAWRVHHDLKRDARTPYTRLASARIDLDTARNRVSRLRIALQPYGNDHQLIGLMILCERIDEVVHIRHLDLTRTGGEEHYQCICGDLVRHVQPVT